MAEKPQTYQHARSDLIRASANLLLVLALSPAVLMSTEPPELAGLVLLAAPARPLDEIIIEQLAEADDPVRWRAAFDDQPLVSLHVYPNLNYLFMSGQGLATPAEYMTVAAQVDDALIEDLSLWIQQ